MALRDRHPSPVWSGSGPGAEQRSSFSAVMFRGGVKNDHGPWLLEFMRVTAEFMMVTVGCMVIYE